MRNPFLIIRIIFLSLLVYLSFVTLAFASWNIHASALPVPGAAFLIFNSIVLCFLATLAMAAPSARIMQVKFECFWTAIFSVLQIAATVSTTVTGLTTCQPGTGNWEACTSSALLVPTAWTSTFTLLTYLFTLFITTASHMRAQPGIWSLAVSSVPWFTRCNPDAHPEDSHQCHCSKKGDIEAPSDIRQVGVGPGAQPPWAQRLHIRRGVDRPFAPNKSTSSTSSSQSSPDTDTVPLLPPPDAPTQQSRLSQPEGSRFIERFQESQLQPSAPWWETPSQYVQFTPHTDVFPRKIDDHDLPIPLPRLSKWIRADAVRGINIRKPPRVSP